jgi:hypothetical protein
MALALWPPKHGTHRLPCRWDIGRHAWHTAHAMSLGAGAAGAFGEKIIHAVGDLYLLGIAF